MLVVSHKNAYEVSFAVSSVFAIYVYDNIQALRIFRSGLKHGYLNYRLALLPSLQESRGNARGFTISSRLVARVTGLPHQVDPSYMNYTAFTVSCTLLQESGMLLFYMLIALAIRSTSPHVSRILCV